MEGVRHGLALGIEHRLAGSHVHLGLKGHFRSSCGEDAATVEVYRGLHISRGEAVGCTWTLFYPRSRTSAAYGSTGGTKRTRPRSDGGVPPAPGARGAALAEHAAEEDGDGAQVASGVEAGIDSLPSERRDDLLLLEHHLAEGPLPRPDAHGRPL